VLYFIGLGSNLENSRFGSSKSLLEAAVRQLCGEIGTVVKKSQWYESEPIPVSDQPWFVNGVVALESELSPQALLLKTLEIEVEFGRVRTIENAARTLDIDIIACDQIVFSAEADDNDPAITLPHPRMHERAFVLLPMAEVAPDWVHPHTKKPISALIANLPPQNIRIVQSEEKDSDNPLAK